MRLHCLGTAGFHPNANRHTSCYFLPEAGVLLDAGTGVFRLPHLIQTDTIDLLLSHAHLDHVCGLTFLLDVFYQRPIEKLRIWGEAAKLNAIRTHLFSDLIFPVELDAEWIAIDDLENFQAGGANVTWRLQDHPGGSVGYRLVWEKKGEGVTATKKGKSLVYLTDTTGDASAEGVEWCGKPDLMMHECYFDDSMEDWARMTGHSWTSRVAEIAAAAMPKKLLVTHINPLIGEPVVKNRPTVEPTGESTSSEKAQPTARPSLPADFATQCELIQQQTRAEVILAEDGLVVDF
ncbi:MAG: MBL fold metallo-hydrolase [Pirellulaceae bacterium]